MKRFRSILFAAVLVTVFISAFVFPFDRSLFKPLKPEQKEPRRIVDVSGVQQLGRDRFQRYMDSVMKTDCPEYSGILSYRVVSSQTAMRAGRPRVLVFSVRADAMTQQSTIPIAWGAVIGVDDYGNCTLLGEGPSIDDMSLR